MTRREILDQLSRNEDERLLLGKIWDKQERCRIKNMPEHTAFLTPQEQEKCRALLNTVGANENCVFWGGYDGAERQQLYFLPEWAEQPEETVGALRCKWYETEELTHRDLLGSLMGLGLTRESIGDILVDKAGHTADVLAMDTAVAYLLQEWHQAGRVKMQVEEIALHDLHIPQLAFREVRDTVASLRLDSIVSAGFSLARGKAADAIESGKVQLNWQEVTKPGASVTGGDVITLRGLGKCELTAVGNPTKKGRYGVTIKRYL